MPTPQLVRTVTSVTSDALIGEAHGIWIVFRKTDGTFAYAFGTIFASGAGKTFAELGLSPEIVGSVEPKIALTSGRGVSASSSDERSISPLSAAVRVRLKPRASDGQFGQRLNFSAAENPFIRITACAECTEPTCPEECEEPDPEDPDGPEEQNVITLG